MGLRSHDIHSGAAWREELFSSKAWALAPPSRAYMRVLFTLGRLKEKVDSFVPLFPLGPPCHLGPGTTPDRGVETLGPFEMYVECSSDIFQWVNRFPISNNVSSLRDLGVCCYKAPDRLKLVEEGIVIIIRHLSFFQTFFFEHGNKMASRSPITHSPLSVTPAWK